jgi:uncharacterized protein YbbK (DUF523 family)
MLLVSACLCGVPCKYNGGTNTQEQLTETLNRFNIPYLTVCPEQLGGLSTPRVPAERKGNRVITATHQDITSAFELGANRVVSFAKQHHVQWALLKEGSPSCGVNCIYNGEHNKTKIAGKGMTTEQLIAIGVDCYSENAFPMLLQIIKQHRNRS